METFFSVLLALTLLCLWVFLLLGRRYVRRGAEAPPPAPAGSWPWVTVIIPVAGASPGLEEQLRSRLTQDYLRYEVIFVTRSLEDPATGVIRGLRAAFPQARQVVSGPARSCGQKNHSLLAGVRAAAPESTLLVFADANQTAPASWLGALVAPLVRGEAQVTGSFHHILPLDHHPASRGRMFTVLMIYLGKGMPGWDQPWGGSTAITRELFQSLEMDRLWSRTVVDDVTLARRLQEAGIPLAASPGAVLSTPAAESMASWGAWFVRQLLYLKFYFPWPWRLAGLGLFMLLGLILLSGVQLVLAGLGLVAGEPALRSGLFLLGFTGLLAWGRALHPAPGPWPAYLAAGYLTLAMALWCHARTWFRRTLRWRGLVYTLDRRGLVTQVQED